MSFWALEWPRLGLKARPYPDCNLARNEGEQVGVNDVPVVEHFGDFLTPPRSLLLTTFPSVAAAAGAAAGGRDRFKRFAFRIL